uniref:Uncharacterized protein n=1 Tax=viral metagenome TaxID=1070528 RepID=A0A6C0AJG9_9ZZZZ
MGDVSAAPGGAVLILNADYVVGNQEIDVSDYVTTQQGANYGAINFPVQKMDDDLRAAHRISAPPPADAAAIALNPPRLTVNYTDSSGAYHTVSYTITETVDIGERSAFGKFVQKPGDVLWSIGLTAAKGQFLFIFVLVWALVVVWSYKQWGFLQDAYLNQNIGPTTDDRLGVLGKYVGLFVYFVFKYGSLIGKPFEMLLGGADVKSGWIVKFIFALLAALTPVSSFLFQFLIWFTLVQTLVDMNNNAGG